MSKSCTPGNPVQPEWLTIPLRRSLLLLYGVVMCPICRMVLPKVLPMQRDGVYVHQYLYWHPAVFAHCNIVGTTILCPVSPYTKKSLVKIQKVKIYRCSAHYSHHTDVCAGRRRRLFLIHYLTRAYYIITFNSYSSIRIILGVDC